MATKVDLRIEGENRTTQAFRGVQRDLTGFENRLRTVTGVARRFIGVFAVGAIARFTSDIIKTDDAASKLARSLGVSVAEVSKLQFVAERAGVSQRNLETGIRTLIQATADANKGTNDYSRAFEELRIDAERFAGLSLIQQIEALADAFGELDDSAPRQDLAITLFGARGGLGFLNVLEEGSSGIQALSAELEQLGGVTTPEAGRAAELAADRITDLTAASTGFARAITGTVISPLTELIEGLTKVASITGDAELSFNKIGQGIGTFLGGISSGQTFNTIATLFGDTEAAQAELQRFGVTGSESGAAVAEAVGGVTVELEKTTAAAEAATVALDKVRDTTPRGAGEGAFVDPGPNVGPPLPPGRVVGEEFTSQFGQSFQRAGGVLTSVIETGIQDGADSATDIFRSFLVRLAAEAAAANIFGALFGSAGGGGGGGLLGGLGGLLGFDQGGVVPGPVGQSRLAVVEGGETIFPTHRRGFAMGGATINVDARGAGAPDLMFKRAVAEAVALSTAQRRDSQRRGRN